MNEWGLEGNQGQQRYLVPDDLTKSHYAPSINRVRTLSQNYTRAQIVNLAGFHHLQQYILSCAMALNHQSARNSLSSYRCWSFVHPMFDGHERMFAYSKCKESEAKGYRRFFSSFHLLRDRSPCFLERRKESFPEIIKNFQFYHLAIFVPQ